MKKVHDLKVMLEKRRFVAKVFREYELEAANEEYKREKTVAMEQFEAKGMELKECLLNDLHDKRKAYDQYRHSIDLAYGGNAVCTGQTRFFMCHRSNDNISERTLDLG